MKILSHAVMVLMSFLIASSETVIHAQGNQPLATPLFVHRIFYGGGSAAAFTLVVDDRQYLITAEHVVSGITTNSEVTLKRMEGTPTKLKVIPIRCESTNVDIIILAPDSIIEPVARVTVSSAVGLGQDVYFWGFPLGFYNTFEDSIVPFVGRGIVSAADTRDPKAVQFYFHGMAVNGFSGGPIFFTDFQTKESRLFGVVKGFPKQNWPVLNSKRDTGMEVESNTGIMVGYPIDHALDAIRKNPIGPVVK